MNTPKTGHPNAQATVVTRPTASSKTIAVTFEEIASIYEGLAANGNNIAANSSWPDELEAQFNQSIHRLVRDRYETLLEPYLESAQQAVEADNQLPEGITRKLHAQVIAERRLARETGIQPPKTLKTINLDAFLKRYREDRAPR